MLHDCEDLIAIVATPCVIKAGDKLLTQEELTPVQKLMAAIPYIINYPLVMGLPMGGPSDKVIFATADLFENKGLTCT